MAKTTTATDTPDNKSIKLTRKQKAFADYIIANPKASASKAVEHTYNVIDNNTARNIASTNLAKANIQRYLDIHADKAKDTVMDIMAVSTDYAKLGGKDGASYASVALQSANSIIDRVDGKATAKVEVNTTSISFNIDLSQALNTD